MPRLNQGQIAKLTKVLEHDRDDFDSQSIGHVTGVASRNLGFGVSEAQVADIAESIDLPLAMPMKQPRTSKNDAILESLKRIEEKLDRVIG